MNIKTTPVERTFPILCVMHLGDDFVKPNLAKANQIYIINLIKSSDDATDDVLWIQKLDGSEKGWERPVDDKIWQDYKPLPKGFKITIEQ